MNKKIFIDEMFLLFKMDEFTLQVLVLQILASFLFLFRFRSRCTKSFLFSFCSCSRKEQMNMFWNNVRVLSFLLWRFFTVEFFQNIRKSNRVQPTVWVFLEEVLLEDLIKVWRIPRILIATIVELRPSQPGVIEPIYLIITSIFIRNFISGLLFSI